MAKPTVSICISAYNEEKNIRSIVMAFLSQVHPNFTLKEIIVVGDGCTDDTIHIVSRIKDKKLKVINGKTRKGLISRVNQLLKLSSSDIKVLADADILLETDSVSELVKPFTQKPNVGMVGAKALPIAGKSLLQKGITASVFAYIGFAESFRRGSNIYTSRSLIALSRQFAGRVNISSSVYAQDAYLYLLCCQLGFEYEYAKQARFWYHLSTTVADHLKQNCRFESTHGNLQSHFGRLADTEYYRPPLLFYPKIITGFLTSPIPSLYISLLNLYCKFFARFSYHKITSRWEMITSTKK